MAITIDANSSANTGNSGTSLSWSHTCSGSDRFLLVSIGTNGGGSDTTGITYGGTTLTQIGVYQEGPTGYRVSLWGLIAPASGTNNIVAAFNEGHAVECKATSFNGVHQSTPTGTFVGTEGTTSAVSLTVSASATWLVVDSVVWNQNDFTASV